eukprot:Hpha_TRINITY_DN14804_c0_g2::TRINITY_DN14804_c0_g2_i1::g.169360::m.169360
MLQAQTSRSPQSGAPSPGAPSPPTRAPPSVPVRFTPQRKPPQSGQQQQQQGAHTVSAEYQHQHAATQQRTPSPQVQVLDAVYSDHREQQRQLNEVLRDLTKAVKFSEQKTVRRGGPELATHGHTGQQRVEDKIAAALSHHLRTTAQDEAADAVDSLFRDTVASVPPRYASVSPHSPSGHPNEDAELGDRLVQRFRVWEQRVHRLESRAADSERRTANDLERVAAEAQLLDAKRREDIATLQAKLAEAAVRADTAYELTKRASASPQRDSDVRVQLEQLVTEVRTILPRRDEPSWTEDESPWRLLSERLGTLSDRVDAMSSAPLMPSVSPDLHRALEARVVQLESRPVRRAPSVGDAVDSDALTRRVAALEAQGSGGVEPLVVKLSSVERSLAIYARDEDLEHLTRRVAALERRPPPAFPDYDQRLAVLEREVSALRLADERIDGRVEEVFRQLQGITNGQRKGERQLQALQDRLESWDPSAARNRDVGQDVRETVDGLNAKLDRLAQRVPEAGLTEALSARVGTLEDDAAAAAGGASAADLDALRKRVDDIASRLGRLRDSSEVDALKDRLATQLEGGASAADLDALRKRVDDIVSHLGTLKDPAPKLAELERDLKALLESTQAIGTMQGAIKDLERRVKALEDALKRASKEQQDLLEEQGTRLEGCEDEVALLQRDKRKMVEEVEEARKDHAALKGYVEQTAERFDKDKAEIHEKFHNLQVQVEENRSTCRDLDVKVAHLSHGVNPQSTISQAASSRSASVT